MIVSLTNTATHASFLKLRNRVVRCIGRFGVFWSFYEGTYCTLVMCGRNTKQRNKHNETLCPQRLDDVYNCDYIHLSLFQYYSMPSNYCGIDVYCLVSFDRSALAYVCVCCVCWAVKNHTVVWVSSTFNTISNLFFSSATFILHKSLTSCILLLLLTDPSIENNIG